MEQKLEMVLVSLYFASSVEVCQFVLKLEVDFTRFFARRVDKLEGWSQSYAMDLE